MKNPTIPPGLHWRKVDLHVHTPASLDFDQRQMSPDEFVDVAVKKGIEAIAVTDHNTGEWVDKIVDAAKGKLMVFPGVEITASAGKEGGIHIIALFDVGATTKTVENLLGALDIRDEKYGKPDAHTPHSPFKVIDIISEHNGLAVLAHADSTHGLLHDTKGEPRTATIMNPRLAAVEVHDFQKYVKMLDGTDPTYRRKLAVYRASDNRLSTASDLHSVTGIGNRYTCFKMDEITLEALRQCFCDPAVRIRSDAIVETESEKNSPRLISLKASQGFLGGQQVEFHEGLNSIIGGKGVGKSLLIEFIRFTLDQPSNVQAIRQDMLGKLNDQLGQGGSIRIVIQLESGQRVAIERTYTDADSPIRVWYEDTHEPVKGRIAEIFPLLAYSQTEAIEIAKDETAQLKLIDSFVDHAAISRQMTNVRAQLQRLDKRLAESMSATFDLESKNKDVATIDTKLRQLAKTLASPKFDEVQNLEPKSHYLDELGTAVDEIQERLESFSEGMKSLQPPALPKGLSMDGALKKSRSEVDKLFMEVPKASDALGMRVQGVRKVVGSTSDKWGKVVEKKTSAYEKWLSKVGGNRQQLLAQRRRLQSEADALRKEIRQLESKATAVTELRQQRQEQLDSLAKLAQALYELRQEEYSTISSQSGDRIKLELIQGGNRRKFFDALSGLKRGSRLRERDIQDLVENITPREFVELVVKQDGKTLASKSGLEPSITERLIQTLVSVDDFADVLAIQHEALPEDAPIIQFLKDDGKYYDLASLSTGQKCTTLLIIALTEGKMPVIIDQPEDALDIPSIYHDITLQLRGRKDSRQFILTTHNPTVAVAADSDKFHVLKGSATSGHVATQGAIDRPDVRGQVIQHLEGGPESFNLKTRKYGIKSE